MNKSFSRWMIIYGIFLIAAGVAGYLSNPEKAKTALMSGGTFGALSIVWGILCAKGAVWSRKAAVGMMAFLRLFFHGGRLPDGPPFSAESRRNFSLPC